MEIILVQDVAKLGYKDDIVKVKDGYANNFLIPQGYAIMATSSNRKVLAENLRQRSFKEEKLRADAQQLADALNLLSGIKIGAKTSDSGKIFGSVNAIQIAEAIKKQHNQEIDRRKIFIEGDQVREVGEYKATISIYKDIKASISFEVISE